MSGSIREAGFSRGLLHSLYYSMVWGAEVDEEILAWHKPVAGKGSMFSAFSETADIFLWHYTKTQQVTGSWLESAVTWNLKLSVTAHLPSHENQSLFALTALCMALSILRGSVPSCIGYSENISSPRFVPKREWEWKDHSSTLLQKWFWPRRSTEKVSRKPRGPRTTFREPPVRSSHPMNVCLYLFVHSTTIYWAPTTSVSGAGNSAVNEATLPSCSSHSHGEGRPHTNQPAKAHNNVR